MKRQKTEDVEVPITPMLDMAFQLLTFFVLTFQASPTEGQFSMNLLPAQPAIALDAPATDQAASNNDLPAGMKTMPATLRANDDGTLGRITLGESDVADMTALAKEVNTIFGDKTLPFDQTVIKVDPKLKYAELIKVIDIFSSKITKISFAELGADEGAAP